ncbi:MAG: WD40/YVTN/BNR-like repeat-containing protein, partial [Planctomycetota bacterium]
RTWVGVAEGLPGGPVLAFAGASKGKGRRARTILYASTPVKKTPGPGGEPVLVGGIHRSFDGGVTWEPVPGRGLNRDTRAFDRWAQGDVAQYRWLLTTDVDPERVYAFNSNTGVAQPHHATVWRSDDAGTTWRATFDPDPRWEPTNVEKNWTVAEDNQFYQGVPYGMAINARDPDQLFFVTSHAYATRDGGATWTCADTRVARGKPPVGNRRDPGRDWACNGLVVTTTWHYAEDPFEPKRHLICYTDIGLALSEDGGDTWQWWSEAGRAPWRNTCYEVAFDPDVRGRLWGAFSNVHDIPNANIIMGRHRASGSGGVCVSLDHGRTWKPTTEGLPQAPVTSIVLDPTSPRKRRVLWAGVFGHGVYRSGDGGQTWTKRSEGVGSAANRRVYRVQRHPSGSLFALVTAKREGGRFLADGVGLYRSDDSGRSWRSITQGARFLWPKDFTLDPADAGVVWLGNADADREGRGGLGRTKDAGRTWRRVARGGPEHFGAYPHPRRRGWVYMTLTEGAPGAGLWLSKDDGRTFHPIEALPFRNAQRVEFPEHDPDRIYVTTFGGSVCRGPPE